MGIFNFLKGKYKINKLEKNHENIDIICENGLNKIYYANGTNTIKQRFLKRTVSLMDCLKSGMKTGIFIENILIKMDVRSENHTLMMKMEI